MVIGVVFQIAPVLAKLQPDIIFRRFQQAQGNIRTTAVAVIQTGLRQFYLYRFRQEGFVKPGRQKVTGRHASLGQRHTVSRRVGLYAGYNKAGREGLVFLNYGWMRNKLHRGVMGMTASADYHSRILELGGEYLYDLQAQKDVPWHVRPYVNVQLSRLWQNGYSETGAGVFNQVVDSKHNDYFGAGAGVEFKRYLAGGNYAIRAGIRHAFAGVEPRLRYSYMGNQANSYDMRNVQDKTHFVLSIGGETEFAKGWSLGGDAGLTRGSHDKDWFCSLTIKRMW